VIVLVLVLVLELVRFPRCGCFYLQWRFAYVCRQRFLILHVRWNCQFKQPAKLLSNIRLGGGRGPVRYGTEYEPCRYHLGTLALGSLIIAICQMIMFILAYIKEKCEKYVGCTRFYVSGGLALLGRC
jgi:hypothetical protein